MAVQMNSPVVRTFRPPDRSYFLFGPRGTGKTTLLSVLHPDAVFVDLLDPATARELSARPERLKEIARGARAGVPIVVDEVQRVPELLMIVHALIERALRRHMQNEQIESLPLYPEMRPCKAPTTDRLFTLFAPVQYHRLNKDGLPVQEFPPELDQLQQTMLELAGLEPTLYQQAVAERG